MTTKPRKPRRMWAYFSNKKLNVTDDRIWAEQSADGFTWDDPRVHRVLVIDLSPDSVEAMEEKVAQAISGLETFYWKRQIQRSRDSYLAKARAALASLGITAGKRGRK